MWMVEDMQLAHANSSKVSTCVTKTCMCVLCASKFYIYRLSLVNHFSLVDNLQPVCHIQPICSARSKRKHQNMTTKIYASHYFFMGCHT